MIQTSVMKEFIGVTHTKFWWNEIASLATRYFTVNGQFYRNFSYVENFYLYFSVMLKSVFKLCFTRKTSVKGGFFSKFQRVSLSYWVVVRIFFLACFETCVHFLKNPLSLLWSISVKSYDNSKVTSSLKLNGIWKLHWSFKDDSFSWTL